MDYQIEELLPIVTKLIDKYTSKESSSVSYEVARMIMGAVTYCIDENSEKELRSVVINGKYPPAQQMYEAGYDIVIRKTYEAKRWYEAVIQDFEDYGCKNYKDTILNGMPEFFRRYDSRFNPQDHLLTLDYPTMRRCAGLCGIDLVLEYLKSIYAEKKLLSCFEPQIISDLLESIITDYGDLYLDNICDAVLLRVVQCAIAGRAMKQLKLSAADQDTILSAAEGKSFRELEEMVIRIMTLVIDSLQLDKKYFISSAKDFAVQIQNLHLL